MEYFDFLREIKRVDGPRNHKIKNSYNTISGLAYYRSIRPKTKKYVLNDVGYLEIIREMNLGLVETLMADRKVKLPSGMGVIEVSKIENRAFINSEGKLIITKPIDMGSTLKLWYEDEEARAAKTMVRHDEDYRFKIRYPAKYRRYTNYSYFTIKFGRYIKARLRKEIVENNFDTYELKKTFNEQN